MHWKTAVKKPAPAKKKKKKNLNNGEVGLLIGVKSSFPLKLLLGKATGDRRHIDRQVLEHDCYNL